METEAKENGRIFVFCEHCQKRILERLPNGLFRFIFGKRPGEPGDPPVVIYIHGSVKMKCLRGKCRKWNVINYLPNITDQNPPIVDDSAKQSG